MDQGNKLYRKCQRPRPYDLRRKVLLKNFLKEQMTFIPQASEMEFENESTVDEENKANYSNDLSSANSNETTDRGEFSVDLNSTFNMESPIEDPTNPDSLRDLASSSDKLPLVDHNTKEVESKTAKFCSFMKLRSSRTKQKKTNGISKAKYNCHDLKSTIKEKPFIKAEISKKIKSFTKKVDNSNEDKALIKPVDHSQLDSKNSNEHNAKNKSLAWRLFRPFRASKRTREGKTKKKRSFMQDVPNIADASISDEGSRTLISRSVQTDMSGDWNMDRLEQSNVLLKEENKLLVESISYFMNDTEIPTRKSFTDSVFSDYQSHSSSSTNSANSNAFEWLDYSDDVDSYHKSKRAKFELEEVRMQKMYAKSSRVSRSKSVQERDNVKMKAKHCHRTQSMRVTSNTSSPTSVRNKTSFYSQNLRMNSWHLNENSHISIPRVKSPSKLQTLSIGKSSRQIQRRSSMPERTLVKKHPKTCYRSGSFRDCHTSGHIPFHEMPTDAFY